jgi:hypothetical protein
MSSWTPPPLPAPSLLSHLLSVSEGKCTILAEQSSTCAFTFKSISKRTPGCLCSRPSELPALFFSSTAYLSWSKCSGRHGVGIQTGNSEKGIQTGVAYIASSATSLGGQLMAGSAGVRGAVRLLPAASRGDAARGHIRLPPAPRA